MSKLLAKLAKATTVKHTSVLSDSKFFGSKDVTTTDLPILNLAFSGSLTGGFKSGLTQFAGPSRHFKCLGPDTPIIVYSPTEIEKFINFKI